MPYQTSKSSKKTVKILKNKKKSNWSKMRSIGPKLSMKAFKVVYESCRLLSIASWPLKSGLKIQIFDVKYVFLKKLKKTAFSVILRTPGFPRFPSPGVMQVYQMPRKLVSRLSGLTPPRRILELVLWKLYFENRIFTILHIFQNSSNFRWKTAVWGFKNRKISNFPKRPSKLFYVPLSGPNTFLDSLHLVWVPLEPPCVRWKMRNFCLKIRIFSSFSPLCHFGP